jgi:hypothetical protein
LADQPAHIHANRSADYILEVSIVCREGTASFGYLFGSRVMRAKRVGLVLAIFFLVAVLFAVLDQMQEPLRQWDAVVIGKVFGWAIGIFVISGLLPVIGWAFGRFRAANAPPWLVIWGLLGVVLAVFSYVGHSYDVEQKIAAFTSQPTLAGKNRDDFVKGAKSSCVASQRQNSLNRQAQVTDQQIDAYCDCFAAELTKAVTVEELRYIVRNGSYPDSIMDKVNQLGTSCSRAVMLRG